MVACPQCGATLETPLACSACGALCDAAPDATPWTLFGLELAFDVGGSGAILPHGARQQVGGEGDLLRILGERAVARVGGEQLRQVLVDRFALRRLAPCRAGWRRGITHAGYS